MTPSAFLLALILPACLPGPKDPIDPISDTGPVDADNDGVLASVDCDDSDPQIALPPTWFTDGDGDGYGDPESAVESCETSAGMVDSAGDCDDDDDSIHPDVPELPGDEVDQDCDGREDCFEDQDRDSWGSSAIVSSDDPDCQDPGESRLSDDCDDASQQTNPDASEIPCNELDEDCDGQLPACNQLPLAGADADYYGGNSYDYLSHASAAGDVDQDGLDDFLVGTAFDDEASYNAGAATLVFGSKAPSDQNVDNLDVRFLGRWKLDSVGIPSAGAGDVNGDGWVDILVSVPYDDEAASQAGAVFLIQGGPKLQGLGLDDVEDRFLGEAQGDEAGISINGIGDIDEDGYDDLAIGADREDSAGSDAGAVYVVLGASVGGPISLSSARNRILGEAPDQYAGVDLSSAGDFDGDGLGDLVVGAYGDESSGAYTGAAFVLGGPSLTKTTSLSDAEWIFRGEEAGSLAGASVSGNGDFNGDGLDDVLVGAHGYGVTYLILGRIGLTEMSLGSADAKFFPELDNDLSGASVAISGNVDGDAYSDVLIGAPGRDGEHGDEGAAYLVLGNSQPADVHLIDADAIWTGSNAVDQTGTNVAFVGDTNGDRLTDFTVAAHCNDYNAVDSGVIYLVLGPGI